MPFETRGPWRRKRRRFSHGEAWGLFRISRARETEKKRPPRTQSRALAHGAAEGRPSAQAHCASLSPWRALLCPQAHQPAIGAPRPAAGAAPAAPPHGAPEGGRGGRATRGSLAGKSPAWPRLSPSFPCVAPAVFRASVFQPGSSHVLPQRVRLGRADAAVNRDVRAERRLPDHSLSALWRHLLLRHHAQQLRVRLHLLRGAWRVARPHSAGSPRRGSSPSSAHRTARRWA